MSRIDKTASQPVIGQNVSGAGQQKYVKRSVPKNFTSFDILPVLTVRRLGRSVEKQISAKLNKISR